MMHFKIIIISLILVKCNTENLDASDLKRKEPGYLFTYPKTFLAGKNETVCLILHDAIVPTKALIDLKIKEKHNTITKIMHSDHSCFELPVPQYNTTEVLSASLHLQLLLNGTISTSHNQEAILIYPNIDATFIETDRGAYKQGDKVKLRILMLTQDLKPSSNPILNLKIINPHGFIVAVWDKLTAELGLAQVEYQLSEETVLGKWKIECNGIYKFFHVKRYTLPRYKVELAVPKTIYVHSKVIKFTVCAKYSFERHVKGIALIKVTYPHTNHNSTTKLMRMQGGCAIFHLTNDDLKLSSAIPKNQNQCITNIVATVTEHGTNQIETETATAIVKSNLFELRFAEETSYFQPGLPYKGRLKIVENNVEINDQLVQICYQIAVKKPWNIKPEECSYFRFEDDGSISFTILPVKDNVVEIKLTAKLANNTNDNIDDTLILKRWYSQTNSYIHLERNTKILSKCKSPQQFTVYYTTNKLRPQENITFYYLLKSRNTILQMRKIHHVPRRFVINFKNEMKNIVGTDNKFLKVENFVDRFILKFKLLNSIVSKTQLMVFYFMKDEIVSSSIDIYVEKCLTNPLEAQWADSKLYPGEYASLNINTSPNSLCAISAVDKASSFLSSSKSLNVHSILHPFLLPRETKPPNKPNCLVNSKKKLESQYLEQLGDLRRKRSYGVTLLSKDYDSFEMFNHFGVSGITNLRLISKPCMAEDAVPYLEPRLFSISSTQYEILNEDRGVSIRSYFPETWLWELVPIGKTGKTQISRFLPHSITTWVTNTICVSPTEGVGVSNKQEIIGFRPFFVDIIMPYSIRRNEIFHLQVSVFNYLNYSLPIKITLGNIKGLRLLDGSDEKKRVTICINSQDVYIHGFRVKGEILGNVNVTVLAEVESSYPSECGPETIINKRDVVYENLLIEPEGYPSEISKSVLLCGNDDSNNITWDVDLPKHVVEGSESSRIILNSDLMGPTIQNLEKFLALPTGCGEQVMSVMAPNLYVLRYLKTNNKLTPGMRQRAVKNIKIGYQRILDYLHKDGSFSAFGYHDPTGSMFLTAFVVRTLQQAKEFTYVDSKVIKKATDWILDHQLENGCFAAVSHVFQDMGGTSMENSTAALTAYVIISLLESNIEVPETVRSNAMYCIRGQQNPDKYTMAISTYALYLLKWESEAERYLTRLLEIATRDGKLLWWSNANGPNSVNIEMTGYVLMSLLYKLTNENLIHGGAVVRWLATQRSSQGGFVTTQDSVVALDAVARYSSVVKNRDPELLIKISGNEQKFDINMQKHDKLKSKDIKFSAVPSEVQISASGRGCVLIQLSITYNVLQLANSEAFTLAVEVNPVSTIDKCSVAVVSSCMSYKAVGHSNMAVLEVTMPSGYEPDRASLFKLLEAENTKVKRFEEYKNRVVLYFTELDNEPICVPFNINENVITENQVNATMKLYDYYNPELSSYTTYKVNKCEPNEVALIPDLSAGKNDTTNETMSEEKLQKSKRSAQQFGLNNDFIDLDIEMATPGGMEGNIPMYINPNTSTLNNEIRK